MTSETLFEMSQVDIDKIDPSTLVDIDTIVINHALTHEDKILSFIRTPSSALFDVVGEPSSY